MWQFGRRDSVKWNGLAERFAENNIIISYINLYHMYLYVYFCILYAC